MKKILLCLIVASSFLLADFSRSSVGVVTDSTTNLQWQDNVRSVSSNWQEAIDYCEALSLDGGAWRLPNLVELTSLVDDTVYYPSISNVFYFAISNRYWSSSNYASNTNGAWIVFFDYGKQSSRAKTVKSYVRCVRAGQ